MLYNHLWTPPTVAIVRVDGRPVHVPLQTCVRCSSTRNPLTGRLVQLRRRGSEECRLAEPAGQDFRIETRRVGQALDAYESDGLTVDREYGRRRQEPPSLPLAYKD